MFSVKQIMEAREPGVDTGIPRIDVLISMAENRLSKALFGKHINEAVALLVLHWLAKEKVKSDTKNASGGGLVLTGEKEGDLSRNYGNADSSEDSGSWFSDKDLVTTSWGKELLSLAKMVTFGARNRNA